MATLNVADWKHIGWHAGKKLRDILRPPLKDNGPTKAERRALRLQDALKGFAYFDTFDEIEEWTPKDVDPVQQSNTPLLPRSGTCAHNQAGNRTKLMLCHDYKGGYHDYESVRPKPVEEELYSCSYLQYVDTFIYFSHKLVCVPPPTWTNTLHRNGVKVLGTFIVEPQSTDVERLLTMHNGKYKFAERLASMAEAFGFDGWLLNIEKEFPYNATDKMIAFIFNLKQALGNERQVVWYDALNSSNDLRYQNGLTAKNLGFADAADALFTNYKWTDAKMQDSARLAAATGIERSKIYFGIDVWAQNTNVPAHPRVTYPVEGGGGTNTGLAAHVLAEHGFSTAVFAPAWSWEHFSNSVVAPNDLSVAKAVDMSLWEGTSLPNELGCDCRKGKPHHTTAYRTNPITARVYEYPAGSSSFLDTDFSKAFLQGVDDQGLSTYESILGSQAVLPHIRPMSSPVWESAKNEPSRVVMYVHHDNNIGSSMSKSSEERLAISIKTAGAETTGEEEASSRLDQVVEDNTCRYLLCLFKTAIQNSIDHTMRVDFSRPRTSRSSTVGLYAAFKEDQLTRLNYQHFPLPYNTSSPTELCFTLKGKPRNATLVEVGIYCVVNFGALLPQKLLQLDRLSIIPKFAWDNEEYDFGISYVRIEERGKLSEKQKRLVWEWHGEAASWPNAIPWSKTTGPFSHFIIEANSTRLGIAHCLEFPLSDEDLEIASWVVEGIPSFTVTGVCFGGLRLQRPGVGTCSL